MANVKNIDKVIAMIEKEENYFNMSLWASCGDDDSHYPENVCGTPSCIGGWAEAIILHEKGREKDAIVGEMRESEVSNWLGISHGDGQRLFYYGNMDRITRVQAVAHLRHIRDGGEVNWDTFCPIEERGLEV